MNISFTDNALLLVIRALRAYLLLLKTNSVIAEFNYALGFGTGKMDVEDYVAKRNMEVNESSEIENLLERLDKIYRKTNDKR